MGHPVSLETPTGRISGWRCDPHIPAKGVVLVIQEIFGVNAHMRHVVDRFAAHGFVAVAPAFFDHIDHHLELGYDEAGVAKGRALVEELGFERVLADVHAVLEQVQHEGKVGVAGFCWGGTVAFLANTRLGLPAVSYYGGRTVPFLHERPAAPLLLHFGEHDPIIPPEDLRKHREALPDAEFHVWPAGHGFNCDHRADYDATVAAQALERTLAFLQAKLA
jgi:carboxymethylenebutenolidase